MIGLLYLGLSIYGMCLFALKMHKLSKLIKPIDGNEQQKKLLYTTTKFVTLLSIAMTSTWIIILWALIGNTLTIVTDSGNVIIRGFLELSLVCIDSTVDIVCLYLQYQFNIRYYLKLYIQ